MTTAIPAGETDTRALGRAFLSARMQGLLKVLVTVWIFSGAFVLIEPSPYEVTFLAAFAVALAGGLKLHRDTLPLLALILLFAPFAMIAVFQVRFMDVSDALLFTLVTIFLMITSYFAANFVAQSPFSNMRLIGNAYITAALIASVVGTLAYLGLLPGEGVFLLYGRAKAFFKDPNVFGPFLILPAMFLLQRALLGTPRRALIGGALYMVLFVGVFVSFSRGAWGHFAASSAMVFFLCFFLEARAQDKVRMLLLAVGGVMVFAAALMVLLSIDSVAELFVHRFSLTQSYDTGETGRFGRIGYALDLALSNPWGIGPLEFSFLKIVELPHNTYINVIHAYGWGGALAYFSLVVWTAWRSVSTLSRRSPNRLLLIPVFSTAIPLFMLAGIIDTDHWRHWFLVVGLVWGITAGYDTITADQRQGRPLI
ncbi:O-antigen ligase family protein [Pelagibacterium limicola]|uniref:O-antigen ligase family protein n=1 Tax=Pelagibacterium limicola TaxID=2791022 RepID=UPI0018AFA16F|nr:O-antigen ligase family protein [Pelagibacterium limicola]